MNNKSCVLLAIVAVAALCVCLRSGDKVLAAGDKQRTRAEQAIRKGEFEGAEKIYRELITKDPQDLSARLGLSYALLKQRKVQDAYDAAARAVALDPLSSRGHALLGASLLASGDFLLSVEEFKTALSFKDDEALAIAGLAMISFHENRPALALAGLRRAMFIDPNEPDFVYNFAKSAARSERYREAADAYENFLRIAPRTDADRRTYIEGLISFLRYLGTQRSLYEAAGAEFARVPFEIVNNRPIINVRLNNSKEVLRFVIDTGSGMCVISEATAKRVGLKSVARGGSARAVGGAGRFEIVYGFLSALHVGEARVENVPVYIRDFHSTQESIDGYLGIAILGKYLSTIDYQERALILDRGAAARFDNNHVAAPATIGEGPPSVVAAIELPMRSTSNGIWCGVISLDGIARPQNFIIDTGATISVVSTSLATREALERYEQKQRLKVYGAAGVAEDVRMLLLPHLTIGAVRHPNLSAAVLDMEAINETSGFEQTGILGGNLLRFFRMTFDFKRGVLRLDPVAGAPHVPLATELQPITATPL